jgi:hypothetical protein
LFRTKKTEEAIGATPSHSKEQIMSRKSEFQFFPLKTTVLACVALAFAGSAAVASDNGPVRLPNGAIVLQGKNGFPMVMNPDGAGKAPVQGLHLKTPGDAGGEQTNLSRDPFAPFVSWYAFSLIEGDSFAYKFIAGKTGRVKEIEIGLAAVDAQDYGYSAEVDLYTDDNGVPGSKIDGSDVMAAETSLGPCCALTTAKLGSRPMLTSGTAYWAIVAPDANSYVAWQLEDTDFVDTQTIAGNNGSGWEESTSQWYVPAMEVK